MRKTANILGVPIDAVSLESAMDKVKGFLKESGCNMITTPNTEIVMEAHGDEEVQKVLMASDLCIPDGIGLIYASKIQKLGLIERVPGVDLMRKILEYANENEKFIYILGGKPGVAEIACENIKKTFNSIRIVGYHDGYFKEEDEEGIINRINHLKPDILFVALGAPRQEKWIYKNKSSLNVKIAMGVGGSVDIWAGTARRAPKAFQKLGLEWFYRLIKEPWRYKRMLALPKFMLKVVLERKSSV